MSGKWLNCWSEDRKGLNDPSEWRLFQKVPRKEFVFNCQMFLK